MAPADDDRTGHEADRALQELVDRERQHDAAADRRRRGWLLRQAGQDTTFEAVLVRLAERRAQVAVDLVCGRAVRGALVEVGADVVVLRPPTGAPVLAVLWAVTALRAEASPHQEVVTGPEPVTSRPRRCLAELLAEQAGTAPGMELWSCDGQRLRGRLAVAGVDVVSVRVQGGDVVHVPLDAVTCVRLA